MSEKLTFKNFTARKKGKKEREREKEGKERREEGRKGKWWPWAWNRHDYIHPTSRQWLRRRATYLKRFLLDASKILWKSDDHSLAVILAEGWNYSCLQACTSFFPLKFFRAEKKKKNKGGKGRFMMLSQLDSICCVCGPGFPPSRLCNGCWINPSSP